MASQRRVILHRVGHDIEQVLPEPEIGFKNRYQILAIVRVYPDAVLQPMETEAPERHARMVAQAARGDIEDKHAPLAVPSRGLFGHERPLAKQRRKPLALWGQPCPPLAALFHQNDIASPDETRERALDRLLALRREPQLAQGAQNIGREHGKRKTARDRERADNGPVYLGAADVRFDFPLNLPHSNNYTM